MQELDLLISQTESTYGWTEKLLSGIPENKWNTTPPTLMTNTRWQAGHLAISTHYHVIFSLRGLLDDVRQRIPLRELGKYYGFDSTPEAAIDVHAIDTLRDYLHFIQSRSLEIIRSLTPEELDQEVVQGKQPHPVAVTKREVISWNIQHNMWHCGQLAILKRLVDKRYAFRG